MPSPDETELAPRKNVLRLGWISLLNDMGSEALARLVPFYVSGILGAPMSAVGAVEGVAESAATLLKPVFGRWSDLLARRKAFVVWGYGLSAIARPFLALAGSWPEVAFLRFCDRAGKGVRTAARDALIADSGSKGRHGRNFGLNRAMDTTGALLGVAAFALWVHRQGDTRLTLPAWHGLTLLCIVPGALTVALAAFGIREIAGRVAVKEGPISSQTRLSPELRRYLGVVALFSLANSSDAFILLRAKELGYSLAGILAMVALLNVVSAATALPAAALSDRLGRRALIGLGWAVYAISYALLGWPGASESPLAFAGIVAFYGLFYGFTDGVERAWVADLAPSGARGKAYGLFGLITGLAALPASAGFGYAWDRFGSPVAFLSASALAWFAAAALFLFMPPVAVATRRAGRGS